MATKFDPAILPKITDKDGNEVTVTYKNITLDYILDWLEENGTDEDRHEFKENLFLTKEGKPSTTKNKKGEEKPKQNFINAKRRFFERHCPELLPKAKKDYAAEEAKRAERKSRIANW